MESFQEENTAYCNVHPQYFLVSIYQEFLELEPNLEQPQSKRVDNWTWPSFFVSASMETHMSF